MSHFNSDNENNILIQENDIIILLSKYQVNVPKIYHLKYFQEAMVHKSYLKKDIHHFRILHNWIKTRKMDFLFSIAPISTMLKKI